ncbi:MAG TPA: NADH-quinone oxidoreductase subunit N [Pirellulales bacterium]|nr:NADH-quinone oxidoreductase subunit N [Pirellulales bacterium]
MSDTTGSLGLFRPELALCATIVVMLLLRVFRGLEMIDAFWVALLGSAVGLCFSAPWKQLDMVSSLQRTELFTGMLVYDSFSIYFRSILLFFALLFVVFTKLSGIPDREDAPDFYTLVLGATVGMCLMATANHLVIVFLGVEMASVPSYALAGMLKGRPRSSEAALKYSVYGAGAAGIMLYGISLLAGVLGSCHLPTMAQRLAELISEGHLADQGLVLGLGGLMVGVGLAFKLSAFPFHFWCPDVFEGAAAEVNAFLSVASKAAALALLVRVAVGFTTLPVQQSSAQPLPGGVAAVHTVPETKHEELVGRQANSTSDYELSSQAKIHFVALESQITEGKDPLAPVRRFIALLVALMAAMTCTFGNLAAYGQTNIKRLMAYSTIAHAGYIMMPVAAAVALSGTSTVAAEAAYAAVPFYVGLYLFMNLGAFAIVAFLRNATGSEEISDFGGLVRVSPGVVVCLGVILFSLVGLPPLAGFAAKYVAFASVVRAMQVPGFRSVMLTLLVVGGLNTALSLFYYLRVMKTMAIDPEPANRPATGFSLVSLQGAYIVMVTLPVLILGIFWDQFYTWLWSGATNLM